MKNLTITFFYSALGAVLFWTPDIVVSAHAKTNFSSKELRFLTVLLPLIIVVAYLAIRRIASVRINRPSIAGYIMLGIWIAGPLGTVIAASFKGGGFSMPGTWPFVIVATIFFPIFTFMMSTYDGTLGALFLTSVFLAVMHIRFEWASWLLPPFIWSGIKRAFGIGRP